MDESKAVITRFYQAFAQRDFRGMAACYHPEVHFRDPVFDLRGAQAKKMWEMLCTNGKDLRLSVRDIEASGDRGSAHWDADYLFSATGRSVHNAIDARFTFRDGLIVEHVDSFDFWRWSRQALGWPGLLLGFTPFLRNKVRARAAHGLAAFKGV